MPWHPSHLFATCDSMRYSHDNIWQWQHTEHTRKAIKNEGPSCGSWNHLMTNLSTCSPNKDQPFSTLIVRLTSSDGKWRKTRLTDLTGYHMLSPSSFFCLSVMFTTCIWFALRVQYILLASLLKIIAANLSGTKKLCIGVCERMANVSSAIRDPESISCARPSCGKFKENLFNHKRQDGADKNCFAPTKLTNT